MSEDILQVSGRGSAYYADIASSPAIRERFDMEENECYTISKPVATEKIPVGNSKGVVGTFTVVIVLLIMLTLGLAACCIAFAFEISRLKTGTVSLEQANLMQQNLNSVVDRLQDLNISSGVMSQLLSERVESQYMLLSNTLESSGEFLSFPASSCAALSPFSPSGYYWVRASNGSAVRVYCNMTLTCGNITGGWMRVAELDMTNSSHQCPSGLMERNDSNIRTCVRDSESAGCSSIPISTYDIPYSKVCGRIIAYQYGNPDAFFSQLDINLPYVDGVSLTHGNPREHIWTFAASESELLNRASACPCFWGMIISVTLQAYFGVEIFFMLITLCGMGLAVLEIACVVSSILPHGSIGICFRLPLMP